MARTSGSPKMSRKMRESMALVGIVVILFRSWSCLKVETDDSGSSRTMVVSRQSYVVIPGCEPIGRLLSNRVPAEQLRDHCGIEVGTHLDDGLPTEPGDPAVMVVEAHPISR